MYLEPLWNRTCEECQKWEYDDEDDSPAGRRGLPMTDPHSGERIPRATDPPCRRCPKVPAAVVRVKQDRGERVVPSDAVEPDHDHRLAVKFFAECSAVGDDFPDDGWVRRCAALIRPYERAWNNRPIADLAAVIQVLIASRK
jgi:hypothetical protein